MNKLKTKYKNSALCLSKKLASFYTLRFIHNTFHTQTIGKHFDATFREKSHLVDKKIIMRKKLILLMSILTLISCSTSSVDLPHNNYVFDGRGGAKCEVDGVEFVPRIVAPEEANSMELQFIQYNGEEYLSFDFDNIGPDNRWLGLRIVVNDVNPIENDLTGSVFKLNNLNTGTYSDGWMNNYGTNAEYSGEFEIVFHNQNKRILSGRYWFDGINSDNEIREIRNGRFDMKY